MSSGAVVAAIAMGLGVVVAAFILHPFRPNLMHAGLDASWIAVMGAEADRGARWGIDLAFTYGPATPLVTRIYNDAYFSHTLPLLVGFAALFGWVAALIVVRPDRSPGGIALAVLAFALATVAAKDTVDAFFITLPFLVFLLAVAPDRPAGARRTAIVVGSFAMGLTAMTKMSFPLTALPLFVLADAASVLRRRWPLLLVPCAFGVVAGDLLYGQHLSDLPAYVGWQGEVVAGYAAAMVLPGPIWDLGLYLMLALGLVAAGVWAVLRDRRGSWTTVVPLGIAIDLLFLFKAGFIRHDLHSLIAWRGLVIVAVAVAVGWLLPVHRRTAAAALALAALVGFVYVPVLIVRQSGVRPRGPAFAQLYASWLSEGAPDEVTAAAAFLTDPAGMRADLDAQAAAAKALIVHDHPLGPLPGSVDILPSEQSRILAAGLDYRPRPSFQEYSTYTQGLASANRAFVDGPRGPDWFLFGPEAAAGMMSIDGRYPNSAEGSLWPDLLRLYRPDHRIGSLLALKRRREPAMLPIGEPHRVSATFNAEVPVAGGGQGAVWATIDAQPNILGRIAGLLFRPPLPGLAVRLDDGSVRRFRFVPELGRAGLILSPLVFTGSQFADLAADRAAPPARRVVAVSLEASRATTAFYDAEIRLSFSPIDTSRLGRDAGAASPEPTGSAWQRLTSPGSGVGLDDSGHAVAGAPSSVELPVAGLDRLALGYGVADGAWQVGQTAGVCFTIRPADGTGATLWANCLDPLHRPDDRGPHAVAIPLPPGTSDVALETSCHGACGADWAYWAEPEEAAPETLSNQPPPTVSRVSGARPRLPALKASDRRDQPSDIRLRSAAKRRSGMSHSSATTA